MQCGQQLADGDNEVFVSVASYWEIVIKYHKGRLELPCEPDEWFSAAVAEDALLDVEAPDITALHRLGSPGEHKDPFDRLLIATASRLDLAIVTSDVRFAPYGVKVVW